MQAASNIRARMNVGMCSLMVSPHLGLMCLSERMNGFFELRFCASIASLCLLGCAQALFRKIAAALPGMESFSTGKQEDLVDVNLADKSDKGTAASQCQC